MTACNTSYTHKHAHTHTHTHRERERERERESKSLRDNVKVGLEFRKVGRVLA